MKMRTASFVVTLSMVMMVASGAPAAQPDPAAVQAAIDDNTPEIIEIIAPAASAQETLATLNLGSPGTELGERNKRTIGILRQLFPGLTQIVEKKIQSITSMLVSAFGPIVLRAVLGNNNNGQPKNTGGGTIELDDSEEEDDDVPTSNTTTTTTSPTTTAADDPTTTETRRKRALYFLPNSAADENQLLSGAESQQAEVRVAYADDKSDQVAAASEDQQVAAQTNAASIDEITLEDADDNEENRNKRFLSFGGSSGGSGGGSGNFLFDIVRRPAEAMARAAGSAFRLFAGTDSLNLGLTASHTATLDPNDPQLVAGSSATTGDSGASSPESSSSDSGKDNNLTDGVPGPVTRLFVIANRGISNLVQDLILRLAQTSERLVNFKARLINAAI